MRRYLVSLFLFAIACSTSGPTPVQVIGSDEDVASMTGEWVGTYEDSAAGIAGSITFTLVEGPNGARGDVVLFRPRDVIYDEHRPQMSASGALVLTIELVHVSGAEVSGKVAAYNDPESPFGTLETHFTGHREGDRIEGTFVTYASDGISPRHGTWRVVRKSRE